MAKEPTVTFTREKLRRFKKAYNLSNGMDTFEFEGHPYVRMYAKYVIEYLEGKFKTLGKQEEGISVDDTEGDTKHG